MLASTLGWVHGELPARGQGIGIGRFGLNRAGAALSRFGAQRDLADAEIQLGQVVTLGGCERRQQTRAVEFQRGQAGVGQLPYARVVGLDDFQLDGQLVSRRPVHALFAPDVGPAVGLALGGLARGEAAIPYPEQKRSLYWSVDDQRELAIGLG